MKTYTFKRINIEREMVTVKAENLEKAIMLAEYGSWDSHTTKDISEGGFFLA